MTEYEYQELLIATASLVTDLVAVFISVLVAYLACAYLVGNKLTKFQLIAVSFTYSMFSLLIITLVYGNLMRIAAIKVSFFELETTPSVGIPLVGPLILLLSWLISIIFMIQVRRSPGRKLRDYDT